MMKRRAMCAALVAVTLLAACSDKKGGGIAEPPAPVPGVLTIMLTTPNDDDRAMIVSVTGPGPITEITSVSDERLLYSRPSTGGFKAAIFGALASGPLISFSVPDVNEVTRYRASVVEVSDATNELRSGLNGYTATVAK